MTAQSDVCPLCGGKGYTVSKRDGTLYTTECRCEVERRNRQRIERSGLGALISRCTFKTFETTEQWQKDAKQMAINYLSAEKGKWFVIYGAPGSGKTHLCTALVGELMRAGKDVIYFLWREEAPSLKAIVNSDRREYERRMKRLKSVPVLYIDDFFKGAVTDGDINLAFELINARYNTGRQTIISGERSIGELLDIDEATGSRIFERSKNFCVKTPNKNWRLK